MCARHNHLPVQFNLFAFYPDEFGGENGYLDPVALRAESHYARRSWSASMLFRSWHGTSSTSQAQTRTCGARCPTTIHSNPRHGAIGSPTAIQTGQSCCTTGPNHHSESGAVCSRAPHRPARGRRARSVRSPKAGAFSPDAVRSGFNPLKDYDYALFAQSVFTNWVSQLRTMIRGTGSEQLITVGQDEGGIAGRPSPAFYPHLSTSLQTTPGGITMRSSGRHSRQNFLESQCSFRRQASSAG